MTKQPEQMYMGIDQYSRIYTSDLYSEGISYY